MSATPLSSIRVVELSHMIMGPSCGMFLAQLGAEVIKVEPPGGDKTRHLTGMGEPFFAMFNRGKRSVTLALDTEGGREALQRLIATADVLVENFRGDTLESMGLDHAALRKRYPRLVIASHKGFLNGPYENRPAMDEVVQMASGLAHMTGPRGRPLRMGSSGNDIMGGLQAAYAVLAALYEREKTGEGATIRIGLFENCLLLVAQHMVQYELSGTRPPPMPEREFSWPVYDIFEAGDGKRIFIGVITGGHWDKLCRLLGLDDLLSDPALATTMARIDGRDRFLPRIGAAVGARDFDTLAQGLETAGIPFAAINEPADMFDDPHVNRPGGLQTSINWNGKPFRVPSPPYEFEGAPHPARGLDVPVLGAATREVLGDLGYEPAEIERLSPEPTR
ncbi:MAG: CoA transferase [Burkholderiaceae bacterium]|nr:CoA transferase [Burkholderiaceae bacterium]